MTKDIWEGDEVMIGKTDVHRKQKIETNRRWNDSYIQKEDVYKLA